ncbi:MAG: ATP-binding cassette domain-containing protein, partial [Bacteroidales bacterium]|nr:ATP-binding cassette domain-containing protein [Bacteroidales bacterium]
MPNPEETPKTEAPQEAPQQPVEEQAAPATPAPQDAPAAPAGKPIHDNVISLHNVDIYQRKLMVLSQVSFDIKSGEFVYLVGKTGTGKSSILKTLIAEIKPKGESATMIGYDLLKMKTKHIPDLRKKIGMVFQDYQLLSDCTVIENLLFVLRATRWKDKQAMLNRCKEVLALVGLETKDFKLPSQLSGGEQQRVCIARALLNNPDVILADEPTGNLDPITAEEIFQIFHHINQTGTTILMATHNF